MDGRTDRRTDRNIYSIFRDKLLLPGEHVYEAFMEKSIFFVSHGKISEITGHEPWMDSEINCLCNVASGRKIWLTLGLKRKSVDLMEINIGDWVTISNHRNLFP